MSLKYDIYFSIIIYLFVLYFETTKMLILGVCFIFYFLKSCSTSGFVFKIYQDGFFKAQFKD